MSETNSKAEVNTNQDAGEKFDLHAGVLGPIETLAQSVSAIAPSTSACLTIPLVFALAGKATWFVYLLATIAIFLIGICVSHFARLSASPGSLYTYTANTLPPAFGATAAWALLLAYIATGGSVAGGAVYYSVVLGQQLIHYTPPAILLLIVVCLLAAVIAWRNVKLSAETMLWIEAVSVGLICVVLVAMPVKLGFHFDSDQFRLTEMHFSGLGPALVLSIFSFCGFESATTLGGEAREPLKTIPRAVLQCALLSGVFFMLCSYAEVMGFRGETSQLSSSTSPLHMLANKAGISMLGTAIDLGAAVSMFACVLACTTAAARVLMRMARGGLLPRAFERTSLKHGTPGLAIRLSALLILLSAGIMSLQGFTGSDIYDLLGSLSVFGFLTAYALVAIALPFARRALGEHSHFMTAVSIVTVIIIVLIGIFDLRSVADPLHARIPYIYLVYISLGLVWYAFNRKKPASVEV